MSRVYSVDGTPRDLQVLLLEAINNGEAIDIPIRGLGETSVLHALVHIDTLHIMHDEDLAESLTDDEPRFPIKYVAVGKAAIDNANACTATLTIHSHETTLTPVGELEVLEGTDLG